MRYLRNKVTFRFAWHSFLAQNWGLLRGAFSLGCQVGNTIQKRRSKTSSSTFFGGLKMHKFGVLVEYFWRLKIRLTLPFFDAWSGTQLVFWPGGKSTINGIEKVGGRKELSYGCVLRLPASKKQGVWPPRFSCSLALWVSTTNRDVCISEKNLQVRRKNTPTHRESWCPRNDSEARHSQAETPNKSVEKNPTSWLQHNFKYSWF